MAIKLEANPILSNSGAPCFNEQPKPDKVVELAQRTLEGIAEPHFGPNPRFCHRSSVRPQIAYGQQDMSICGQRESAPKSSNLCKKASFAIPSLDASGKPIWTHRDFDWAYRNPFATVITRGNDYVTEQWSEDYVIACKRDIELAKESLKNVGLSLRSGHGVDALAHLANAMAVALKLVMTINLGNFVKGALGIAISSGKSVFHIGATVVYLALAAVSLLLRPEKAEKLCTEFLSNLGFFVKDLVSIMACVGQAVPSWVPLTILFAFPLAGIALSLVKAASEFTGVFDLLAYGNTALLLYAKVKFARRDLSRDPNNEEAKKAIACWENLKKELNPLKSIEGAVLATFGANIAIEGVTTLIGAIAPGAHVAAKYAGYALVGATGATLLGINYRNMRLAARHAPVVEVTKPENLKIAL